jgi:hypothetical protein
MVSWYFKHSNDIYEPKTVEGFREWLKGGLKHHWKNVDKTNWEEIAWDGSNDALSSLDFINNDKDIYIDFLGRVENIEEDWRIICESSNKEYKPLAHINKSEHEDYRDYYDEESAEIIYERFERDIGFFDYRF